MARTIGLDATSAATQSAGIGRYTRHLLSALSGLDSALQFRLFYCARGGKNGRLPQLDSRFRVRPIPISDRVLNAVWHRLQLPIPVQLATGGFDLFHSPDFTLPPTLGKPTVLTVHDLVFLRVPACSYPTLRAYLQTVVPRSVEHATRIIAVSEATRRDLIEYLGVAPERVTTIFNGVSPEFQRQEGAEAWEAVQRVGVGRPFILSVGTLEPRKNYVRLLEAYALIRERGATQELIIAGARGWMYDPIFRRLHELRLEEHVRFVRPDDRVLVALYSLADAFIYPSLYEGFGLPPLEALACGAPTACSSTSSLPEVVGEAALTFDPENVEEMADRTMRLLSEDSLRADLRKRGPERARSFSWDRTARATLAVYEEILADA